MPWFSVNPTTPISTSLARWTSVMVAVRALPSTMPAGMPSTVTPQR